MFTRLFDFLILQITPFFLFTKRNSKSVKLTAHVFLSLHYGFFFEVFLKTSKNFYGIVLFFYLFFVFFYMIKNQRQKKEQ